MKLIFLVFVFSFASCSALQKQVGDARLSKVFDKSKPAKSIQCLAAGEDQKIEARLVNPLSYYPESPLKVGGDLFYVEYSKHRVMFFDGKLNRVFWTQTGCGPAAIALDGLDFLVTCYDSNSLVRLSKKGKVLETYSSFKGPNDFAPDGQGGIFFTASGVFDVDMKKAPIEGKIFYKGKDHKIREIADGIYYANGIAVDLAGKTLFVSEHLKNQILEYKIEPDGDLKKPARVFADLNKLPTPNADLSGGLRGPDGMKLSKNGILFVAQYAGARILKFQTLSGKDRGSLIGEIRFRGPYPNTDNLWLAEEGTLFGSAVEESPNNPDYPGIIYQISDPLLNSRKLLDCNVEN